MTESDKPYRVQVKDISWYNYQLKDKGTAYFLKFKLN
jgi:hypothetical protein